MTKIRDKQIFNSVEEETKEFFKDNSSDLNNDSNWAYSPVPNELELKGKFFTAGIFIDHEYSVTTVMDKVANGRRNPKLPGGMTQDVIFHDNSYFSAIRSALESCKIYNDEGKEVGRVYSEPVISQIIGMENRRDKINDKNKISKRNVVLEFIEELGCYPSGMDLCWYQHQKMKNWHRFFFLVKELYCEKDGELVLIKKFEPVKGFKSTDQEIAFSVAIKFSQALKEQNAENVSEVLFPPHQSALRTAGFLKCIDDRKFAYLYDSYCFSPYPYWDKKNPPVM